MILIKKKQITISEVQEEINIDLPKNNIYFHDYTYTHFYFIKPNLLNSEVYNINCIYVNIDDNSIKNFTIHTFDKYELEIILNNEINNMHNIIKYNLINYLIKPSLIVNISSEKFNEEFNKVIDNLKNLMK